MPGARPILVAAFCVACALAVPASAQYFGQNKVQYNNLKFEVLKTEHFDIYFYPAEREGIQLAARMAERWYARLSRVFEHRLRGRQPLILYASHADFEQTNVIEGELGEGTGGVTEPVRRRIVLPLGGPLADTDHVIGHELVHAFQFDMTSGPGQSMGENGAERLPLWFIEGMAEYLSLGPVDPNTAMWLRDAVVREKLPAIKDLNNPRYFPYRWGQAFWAYVGGRFGDDVIPRMLTVAASAGVDTAFERVLDEKEKELSGEWKASIQETYEPVLSAMARTGDLGQLVIEGKESSADLNVGPAISPDGRWIAFLSDRDFLSTDLYVADALTGRIVHKLTSTATNPHYSSIQFIYSAGAWDRASRQLAVGTVSKGRAALTIFDVSSGKASRDIPVAGVAEVLDPTWAPDGHAICFTGMAHGVTDLFVYDLNAGTLRSLTRDAYADLQPAWSPDGRRIAFATDRFTSDLRTLAIGAYGLALIDPESGVVEPVPAFGRGKHIDPQWSPDGRSLYFISDQDGVPNVYRIALDARRDDPTRITRVGTGVSGITTESPAMSVAASEGVMALSVYQGGKYDIYTLDPIAHRVSQAALAVNGAALPPRDRNGSEVLALLDSPALGLPETTTYPEQPYKSKLSLESVSEPMAGVGVSRFGTTVGGGMSFLFGDMLENHQLGAAVQFSSGFGGNFSVKDIGAQVVYFNQAHRWNWGLVGSQIPYLSGGYQSTVGTTSSGDLLESDQLYIFRQTELSGAGIVAYPFDSARRVEFQAGATRISFDQVVTTTTYSLYTGTIYDNSTVTTPLAQPLTLGITSAAYVFDTSSFGATSPVEGQRYRLEASPTFGSINFTGLMADYRRYFMPASFYTFAVRGMHYGRYGSGSEDPRLFPLYIGYPGLVRGYDIGSFQNSECVPTADSSCPAIDRLLGSRMLLGSAEFRFPLLRPFGVSTNMYGPLPVEVAFFTDGGVAWNSGEKPSIFGGARSGVSSAGVALRTNLFGFAIGEFDFTRPFQRPGRGWIFSFNLMPGW